MIARRKQEAVYRPIAVEAVEVIKLCDDLGDLLNSDYAGHRLTFVQFAQVPVFNHLNSVYNALDFSGPLDFVPRAAGLSDRVASGS